MVYALEINPTTFPASRFFSISSIVNIIVPLAMIAAALVLLLMLMLAALNWISAGGNPEKLEKARSKMKYALIGFVIIIASYLIVQVIGYMLGIDFLL